VRYDEARRQRRDRALQSAKFQLEPLPRAEPMPTPPPGEHEVGWSEEHEVDASLFFPWASDETR
jgi:hypothetical protein